MSKRIASFILVLILVLLFVSSAFADGEAKPGAMSVVNPGGVIVVDYGSGEGNERSIIAEIFDEVYDTSTGTEKRDYVRLVYTDEQQVQYVNLVDEVPDDEELIGASQELYKAYEHIKECEDISQIDPEIEPELAERVTAVFPDAVFSDYVVRDVIDVVLGENVKEYLKEHDKISILFKVGIDPDEDLIVLHNYEDDRWEIIPDKYVDKRDDGYVKVSFDSLSPVAFIVLGDEGRERLASFTVPEPAPEPITEGPEPTVAPEVLAEAKNDSTKKMVSLCTGTGILGLAGGVIIGKSSNKKKRN